MFSWFKKKKSEEQESELHYDPSDIQIEDLRKGYLVDFDLQTWHVVEEYEYDWGNERFSYEFKLANEFDACYLSLDEERGEIIPVVCRPVLFSELDATIEETLRTTQKPPSTISYKGILYKRQTEKIGYFRNIDSTNWFEYIVWEFVDDTRKNRFYIEQWDEESFDAFVGVVKEKHAFTNILPN
ncbi:MAG: DUF4178 domain-containing protein [Cytophagales bacterium]|nr:DUF4178 domain-containing protein [Cytophagales bacterium]MDW8384130.1 DUF4178 domain-containing protein [Flammeovirgaceae bacterium]